LLILLINFFDCFESSRANPATTSAWFKPNGFFTSVIPSSDLSSPSELPAVDPDFNIKKKQLINS
jgi:hypothetical protein